MAVKINCCFKSLKLFKKRYPSSIFLDVTRSSGSVLSPSAHLLKKAGIYPNGGYMTIPFQEFKEQFIKELYSSDEAKKLLLKIHNKSKNTDIYLVCVESDPEKCHRSILKEILYRMEIRDNRGKKIRSKGL